MYIYDNLNALEQHENTAIGTLAYVVLCLNGNL